MDDAPFSSASSDIRSVNLVYDDGFCLDVTKYNTADGTPLQIWKCGDAQENQLWSASGGIIVGYVGKCVTADASQEKGSSVTLATCDGRREQRWTRNGLTFVSAAGMCLDVRWNEAKNGTAVQLWECNGTTAQQWAGASATDPTPTTPPPPPAMTLNSVAQILGDMQTYADSTPGYCGGAQRSWDEASIAGPSNGPTIKAMTSPRDQHGNVVADFASRVDNVVPWIWVFGGANDQSRNTVVELRNLEAYYLTDDGWHAVTGINAARDQRVYPCAERFDGSNYVAADTAGNYACDAPGGYTSFRSESDGVSVVQMRPVHRAVAYEVWAPNAGGGSGYIGNGAMLASKAILVTAQMRLALRDPNGTDDRGQAEYAVQMGYDTYIGSPWTQMDGVDSRVRYITEDWQAFNVMTIETPACDEGLSPRYGGQWNSTPYQRPPYVITADDLRATPPPLR